MKLELKKIVISFLIVNFFLFYLNSGHLRGSFLHGVNTTFVDVVVNFKNFMYTLDYYIISYVLFNIAYFTIYFVLKLYRSQVDNLKITTIIIISLCFIYIINDQIILQSIKDYKFVCYFNIESSGADKIDSTNYRNCIWLKRAYSIGLSSATEIVDERIKFNSDSTFTVNGRARVLDNFFLVRILFNKERHYEYKYKYKFLNKGYEYFEGAEYYYFIKIKQNRLTPIRLFFKAT